MEQIDIDNIRENPDKFVHWGFIATNEKLSEEFLREFSDKLDWHYVSAHQKLSEEFIREFSDKVIWYSISRFQKLSEEFIREFSNKINWDTISMYQKLSEEFIREFSDKVDWDCVSGYQKLSESFINEFADKVCWTHISTYQKLSEEFIREFSDKVWWRGISEYQKLSEEFRNEYKDKLPYVMFETCWLYKTPEWKERYIREKTEYKIENAMVIAYKSCREDGYSRFNFQYKYEIGKEYESTADSHEENENSFGLSAWTREGALKYCKEKLFKVGIRIGDIACVVRDGGKIRATRIKILGEEKI